MAPPPPLVKDFAHTETDDAKLDGGVSCASFVMVVTVMAMTVNCGDGDGAVDDDNVMRSPSSTGPLHRAFRKRVF